MSESPEVFSLEELVSELQQIAERADVTERPLRTYRTAEIQEALGMGREAAMNRIHEWIDAGICKPTKAPHKNAWGVVQMVPMVQFTVGGEYN